MDKAAIRTFAIQSRKDLMAGVSQKAYELGITDAMAKDNTITSSDTFVVHGKLLDPQTQKQRNQLIHQIQIKGYDQVIEEVAYTWFNRIIALRFMEVNGYLPSRIRVFTDHENQFKPELLDQALHLPFKALDKDRILSYLEANDDEGLYKYLFIIQCNDMNRYLPEMFEELGGYSELLLPDGLLRPNGVISNMIELINESAWLDQIEIIGWLYQYYNEERKDQVVNVIKRKTIKKNDIPAATQLFTTDWVVRYMIDNSLGKYWLERNPDSTIKSKLEYYMPHEPTIISDSIKPIDLRVFDPCMGSGHILVYAFEVLMEIYLSEGYHERDAAMLILEHNLYGLDIDDRAYQLSYFALMMKARKYNRRILEEELSLNVASTHESDSWFDNEDNLEKINLGYNTKEAIKTLFGTYKNAKEYGSLINAESINCDEVCKFLELDSGAENDLFMGNWLEETKFLVRKLYKQTQILKTKYHAVVTNPPYLNRMDKSLKTFVEQHYKDYSTDLFSVFMYRNFKFCEANGYNAMMTPFVWMFIKSYEKLRNYIVNNKNISSLIQMEYSAFEVATVPICSFILSNQKDDTPGVYIKLSDFTGGMEIQRLKVIEILKDNQLGYFYRSITSNYRIIPGMPIAYWIGEKLLSVFKKGISVNSISDYTGSQNKTANNRKYLRYFWEVKSIKIGTDSHWVLYAKGGDFRKHYGNLEYVVDWSVKAQEFYSNNPTSNLLSKEYWYQEGITYTMLTSRGPNFRYLPNGCIFDMGGPAITHLGNNLSYILSLLNSNISKQILSLLNPTLNLQAKDVKNIPIIVAHEYFNSISEKGQHNIKMSKTDWDSFETSWDFEVHPLIKQVRIKNVDLVSESYELWKQEANTMFSQLKANEEELNRIFIEIYGLEDELTPEVSDRDITITKIFDNKTNIGDEIKGNRYVLTKEDIMKSFVSYAIGCMLGRYSLDYDGLAYAGGEWHSERYTSLIPSSDNVLVLSEGQHDNDALEGLIKFVELVYGKEQLEANLEFIANGLNKRGESSRAILRNYLMNDFYKDHVQTYKKRPIYWLFDSGKDDGFKALIYMHRYDETTLAKLRLDYVHPTQEYYHHEITHLNHLIDFDISEKDKARYRNELIKLNKKAVELLNYEQKLHHLADQRIKIDLDDGVVVNYEKFKGLVKKY